FHVTGVQTCALPIFVEASDATTRARYRHDAFGRRITKDVEGGRRERRGFLYRDQRVAAEIDGRGRVLRHYLYWKGAPLAVFEPRPEERRVGKEGRRG